MGGRELIITIRPYEAAFKGIIYQTGCIFQAKGWPITFQSITLNWEIELETKFGMQSTTERCPSAMNTGSIIKGT